MEMGGTMMSVAMLQWLHAQQTISEQNSSSATFYLLSHYIITRSANRLFQSLVRCLSHNVTGALQPFTYLATTYLPPVPTGCFRAWYSAYLVLWQVRSIRRDFLPCCRSDSVASPTVKTYYYKILMLPCQTFFG